MKYHCSHSRQIWWNFSLFHKFLKQIRLLQTLLHAFISKFRLQVRIKEENLGGTLERSKFMEVLPATFSFVVPKTQAVMVVSFVLALQFDFMLCSLSPYFQSVSVICQPSFFRKTSTTLVLSFLQLLLDKIEVEILHLQKILQRTTMF